MMVRSRLLTALFSIAWALMIESIVSAQVPTLIPNRTPAEKAVESIRRQSGRQQAIGQQAITDQARRRAANIDALRQQNAYRQFGYLSQSNYITRRPAYRYNASGRYADGPALFRAGYHVTPNGFIHVAPAGFVHGGFGAGGFGAGGFSAAYGFGPAYGFQPAIPAKSFRPAATRVETRGDGLRLPGSNYFPPPHASQYIPLNR